MNKIYSFLVMLNQNDAFLFRFLMAINDFYFRIAYRKMFTEEFDGFNQKFLLQRRTYFLKVLDKDYAGSLSRFLREISNIFTPPHSVDENAIKKILSMKSHIAMGIFHEGKFVGYLLMRLFFPKRNVVAIGIRKDHQLGLGKKMTKEANSILKRHGFNCYATVDKSNLSSLKGAQRIGYKIVGETEDFYLLRVI